MMVSTKNLEKTNAIVVVLLRGQRILKELSGMGIISLVSPKDLKKPNTTVVLLLQATMLLRGWRDLDKPKDPSVGLLTLLCWRTEEPRETK